MKTNGFINLLHVFLSSLTCYGIVFLLVVFDGLQIILLACVTVSFQKYRPLYFCDKIYFFESVCYFI